MRLFSRQASVGADRHSSVQRLLAIYQVLHDRYATTTGLQWQVAVYTIAAQAALIAGIIAAPSSAVTWIFSVAALAVGVLGALTARRIELTAWLDREQLDELEADIAKDHPEWLLHHGDTFKQRLKRRGLQTAKRSRIHEFDLWLTRYVPPGSALALVMALLGLSALIAAIIRS